MPTTSSESAPVRLSLFVVALLLLLLLLLLLIVVVVVVVVVLQRAGICVFSSFSGRREPAE